MVAIDQGLDWVHWPLYIELEIAFSGQDFTGAFAQVAKHCQSNHLNVQGLVRQVAGRVQQGSGLNRVFISADYGHPFGRFFHHLGLSGLPSPEAWLSILASFLGSANRPACEECIIRWRSTVTKHREHVNYPFAACISAQDVGGGACSNCIYHGKAETCTRVAFQGWYQPQLRAGDRGPADGLARGFSGSAGVDRGAEFWHFSHMLSRSKKLVESRKLFSWDENLKYQTKGA